MTSPLPLPELEDGDRQEQNQKPERSSILAGKLQQLVAIIPTIGKIMANLSASREKQHEIADKVHVEQIKDLDNASFQVGVTNDLLKSFIDYQATMLELLKKVETSNGDGGGFDGHDPRGGSKKEPVKPKEAPHEEEHAKKTESPHEDPAKKVEPHTEEHRAPGKIGKGIKAVGEKIKSSIAKIAGPRLAKISLGSIPLAGVAIGFGFGIWRAIEGDYTGAAAEVAGGAASTIPGIGTAAALTIQAGLIARDVYHDVYGVFPEEDTESKEKLKEIVEQVKGYILNLAGVDAKKEPSTPTPVPPPPVAIPIAPSAAAPFDRSDIAKDHQDSYSPGADTNIVSAKRVVPSATPAPSAAVVATRQENKPTDNTNLLDTIFGPKYDKILFEAAAITFKGSQVGPPSSTTRAQRNGYPQFAAGGPPPVPDGNESSSGGGSGSSGGGSGSSSGGGQSSEGGSGSQPGSGSGGGGQSSEGGNGSQPGSGSDSGGGSSQQTQQVSAPPIAGGESSGGNSSSGGDSGSGGNAPPASAKEVGDAARVIRYFEQAGWTHEQAAGIAANIDAESSFKTDELYKGHYGLVQWDQGRQQEFQNKYHKPIQQATFDEQLAYVQYELTEGAEKSAGTQIRTAKTPEQAAELFAHLYERSGSQAIGKRIALAKQFAAQQAVQTTQATPGQGAAVGQQSLNAEAHDTTVPASKSLTRTVGGGTSADPHLSSGQAASTFGGQKVAQTTTSQNPSPQGEVPLHIRLLQAFPQTKVA